ncbi:hypothetical protein [Streptomyces decoyicus]|uniref:hypothetical protein n=1 Tax=Streptomyces decoyicus TaxID=249567 RepID=UPI002E19D844|nr:hypothetical protein OG532_05150 [Streptomyces decoyicus]
MKTRAALTALAAAGILAAPAAAAHAAPSIPPQGCPKGSIQYAKDNGPAGKLPYTKSIDLCANKKTNKLYTADGDWYTKKAAAGPVYMKLIIDKPKAKPYAYNGKKWIKAKKVTGTAHVYRGEWKMKKALGLPSHTRVHIQIKGHGNTPTITL